MKKLRLVILWAFTAAMASTVFAQSVPVDQAGANRGNLTTGALLFGGQEPANPILCLAETHLGSNAPCPNVNTMEGIVSARMAGPQIAGRPLEHPPNQFGLDLYTDNFPRLSITHAGRIGIGTQTPTYNVQIQQSGDVQLALISTDSGGKTWALQSSGKNDQPKVGTFQIVDRDQNIQRLGIDSQGLVSVKALQITGGADLAEPFKTTGGLAPGSLVVIDANQPGRLLPSTHAYDRRVAGVVSGANDIHPGVSLEQLDSGDGKQQVALSGRVYALADASNGPIRPGDFLTTSRTAAHAMKAANLKKAQGAIIGKAMSGLEKGEGLVLVLVSLQ
jgi:hypothetical protein